MMMVNPTAAIAQSFLAHFLHHSKERSLGFAIQEVGVLRTNIQKQ